MYTGDSGMEGQRSDQDKKKLKFKLMSCEGSLRIPAQPTNLCSWKF